MEAHLHLADADRLAEARDLPRLGKILAIAQSHDVERFARRHHGSVAGSGMIGMAMGDQRSIHLADRVDIEIAGRAIETARRRAQEIVGLHGT